MTAQRCLEALTPEQAVRALKGMMAEGRRSTPDNPIEYIRRRLITDYEHPDNFIDHMFHWALSEEGHSYWSGISYHYYQLRP